MPERTISFSPDEVAEIIANHVGGLSGNARPQANQVELTADGGATVTYKKASTWQPRTD